MVWNIHLYSTSRQLNQIIHPSRQRGYYYRQILSYSTKNTKESLHSLSKVNFRERNNVFEHLQKDCFSIEKDVILSNNICKSCQKNFFSMDLIGSNLMQRFIEFQFNRPEFFAYFSKLKTLSNQRIHEFMIKELHVIERFSKTIPNAQEISYIVDEANVTKKVSPSHYDSYVNWSHQNSNKTINITAFHASFQFKTQTNDQSSNKLYTIKNRCYFPGYDDLVCIYLSILFPQLPLIYSFDRFRDHIKQAYLFEKVSGQTHFGISFERILANVCYPRHTFHQPELNRNGFYLPSLSFSTHHCIHNGESFCIKFK